MKKVKTAWSIILFSGIFICLNACNSKNPEKGEELTTQETTINKEAAEKILDGYLKVKNALVSTDGPSAKKHSNELLTLLVDENDKLTQKLKFDTEHIGETEDPSHQRDHFENLSKNVYTLAKLTGIGKDRIYKQYCPMALNNKGAFWLSSEKEVNNPYFGDMMLHCGSVQETF